jgi:hypothetical protein
MRAYVQQRANVALDEQIKVQQDAITKLYDTVGF